MYSKRKEIVVRKFLLHTKMMTEYQKKRQQTEARAAAFDAVVDVFEMVDLGMFQGQDCSSTIREVVDCFRKEKK